MQKAVRNKDTELPRLLTIEQLEVVVLAVTAPLLLLPGQFPEGLALAALGLLTIPSILRYWRTGAFVRYTHANVAVLSLLFIFFPLSLILSPLPVAVSWPRFTALVWSVALFFALANWPADVNSSRRDRTQITLPSKLFLVLGAAAALISLVGMQSVDKIFYLPLPESLRGWPIFGSGLATNEVAGALTLFVPFAAALALGGLVTRRNKLGLAAGAVTLLCGAVMVVSQSRTALFSTAIALALVMILFFRPSPKWIGAALVAIGAGAILASQLGLLNRFIYAGANSWDSVIGPRLDVWGQGVFALQDFALWGMGLGTFGLAVTRLYPLAPVAQAKILEDAHNLYLQSMLDLGVLGGLVFIGLLIYALVVLARKMRHRPPKTMGRAWFAGVFAALIAHMLYSMTDAVALGTVAGIPLWYLLGMTMARTHDTKPALTPARVVVATLAIVVLAGGLAWVVLPTNQAARLTTSALLQGRNYGAAADAVATAAEARCDLRWHEGLLYAAQNQPQARDAAWTKLLGCTDRFARFMPIFAPDNAPLAQEIINLQPASPVGYFWLAEIMTPDNPDAAIQLYRQGLRNAPEDGRRWAYLGNLLIQTDDLDGALEAYLQSCHNGDPGANGCLQAGNVAQQQGKIADAIAYYRLSKFSGSLEKAEALERQLAGQE